MTFLLSKFQTTNFRNRDMKCVSYIPASKSSKELFLWLVKIMLLNKKMTEHCNSSGHFLACILHVAFYYFLIHSESLIPHFHYKSSLNLSSINNSAPCFSCLAQMIVKREWRTQKMRGLRKKKIFSKETERHHQYFSFAQESDICLCSTKLSVFDAFR